MRPLQLHAIRQLQNLAHATTAAARPLGSRCRRPPFGEPRPRQPALHRPRRRARVREAVQPVARGQASDARLRRLQRARALLLRVVCEDQAALAAGSDGRGVLADNVGYAGDLG